MIFLFLFNTIYLVIAFYIGKEIISASISIKKNRLFLIGLWLFLNLGNIPMFSSWNEILVFFASIALYRFLFKLPWSKVVPIAFCFFSIASITKYIGGLLSIFEMSFNAQNEVYTNVYFLTLALAILTLWGFIKILVHTFQLFDQKVLPSYSWIFIFLPLSIFALFLNTEDYFKVLESQRIVIALFLIFVVSNFILSFLHSKLTSVMEIETELGIQKEKEKQLLNQIEFLNQQHKLNMSFVHELLQKENKIVSLIKEGNEREAISTLESLAQNTFQEFNGILTESNVFNAIITQFHPRIHQAGFQLRMTISINDFEFMNLSEQYDFFYHLIDNLLHCAEKRITKTDQSIIITCKRNKSFRKIECFIPLSTQNFDCDFDDNFASKYHLKIQHQKLEEYKKEKIELLLSDLQPVK